MRAWYPVLVGGLALARARELTISRRRERSRPGQLAAAGTFPLMVGAHVGLFILPLVEVAALRRRPRWVPFWLALLLAATGLRWWSIRTLGDQWNVRAAVPSDLRPVTAGPYRWIRHPNYLAVVLEFLALPMAGGAWMSALGLSAWDGLVLIDRVRGEEALLFAVPSYRAAFERKSRLIPGIF
ncbi:MAG TPA: isoprenylcysteine carboxylmethyltransferase family protein [Candidatus Dormibacteraeota bacterium]